MVRLRIKQLNDDLSFLFGFLMMVQYIKMFFGIVIINKMVDRVVVVIDNLNGVFLFLYRVFLNDIVVIDDFNFYVQFVFVVNDVIFSCMKYFIFQIMLFCK